MMQYANQTRSKGYLTHDVIKIGNWHFCIPTVPNYIYDSKEILRKPFIKIDGYLTLGEVLPSLLM